MRSYYRNDIRPSVVRYTYPIKSFSGIDAYSEENSLPLSWARYAYNVSIKNGVLKGGVGISVATINGEYLPNAVSVGSRPIRACIYRRYDKTNEKRELSYFQSLLGKYISEHHPELSNDKAFLSSRADEALNVYANAITIGLSDLEAEEAANEILYNGLHFSKYDTIVEVLWNEFAENIPQSLAERLAAILLGNTAIQKTFAKYKLDDDFDGKPEYDELYTELTGCIQIIIERNELPVF